MSGSTGQPATRFVVRRHVAVDGENDFMQTIGVVSESDIGGMAFESDEERALALIEAAYEERSVDVRKDEHELLKVTGSARVTPDA